MNNYELRKLTTGESSAFKERSEGKQSKLSLTEILAGRDKLAQGLQKIADKVGISTFAALFGLELLKELDRASNTKEFKWMAARTNVRELAQLYGRKFLQPGKAETKNEKTVDEEERELELKAKHEAEAGKKMDDVTDQSRKETKQSDQSEGHKTREEEQEDEIAQDSRI